MDARLEYLHAGDQVILSGTPKETEKLLLLLAVQGFRFDVSELAARSLVTCTESPFDRLTGTERT